MADRRAVFLDRDGVLNEALVRDGKPYPPRSIGDVRLVAEAQSALARLKESGFVLLVVTNQPDISRGSTSFKDVEAINHYLADRLPVDEFFVCPHDGAEDCICRKPKPGLLAMAAEKFQVDLAVSFMIGDRWRDVEAGHRAGCSTVWIDCGYSERGPEHEPDKTVLSLVEAVDWILSQGSGKSDKPSDV